MFGLGPTEMLIVLVIGVLLFGKNLPNVGRQLGKGLMEFKKGLSDIKSEVDLASYSQSSPSRVAQRYAADDFDEPTAPKFEPPAQEPFEPPAREPNESPQSESTSA
ncbi:MAG: twin-arginine translocase TatA/TatE family subunit [Pirellulales bacterium]